MLLFVVDENVHHQQPAAISSSCTSESDEFFTSSGKSTVVAFHGSWIGMVCLICLLGSSSERLIHDCLHPPRPRRPACLFRLLDSWTYSTDFDSGFSNIFAIEYAESQHLFHSCCCFQSVHQKVTRRFDQKSKLLFFE